MVIFGITVNYKDDSAPGKEEPVAVTLIQEKFKTEIISSSERTIELVSDVKIEIPDCLQVGAPPAYLNSVKITSI